MTNLLGGIIPEIPRAEIKINKTEKQKHNKLKLFYDERHSNKRDIFWFMKKYHKRFKEWWEMWD